MKNEKFVIGVIGTQNTGKSTFIKDLIGRFKGTASEFITVGCDYRKKIEEAGLKINRNGNVEAQKIICDTLIEQLDLIRSMPSGNYVTDRSPIDAYAYSTYLMRHSPESGVTQKDLDEMLVKVRAYVTEYDKLIYIDLANCQDVKVVDDKFRDTDLEYRTEIDSIFKETFTLLGDDVMKDRLCDSVFGDRESRVNAFVKLFSGNIISKIEYKIMEEQA